MDDCHFIHRSTEFFLNNQVVWLRWVWCWNYRLLISTFVWSSGDFSIPAADLNLPFWTFIPATEWFMIVFPCSGRLSFCSSKCGVFPQRTSCVIKVSLYLYYRSIARNELWSFSERPTLKLDYVLWLSTWTDISLLTCTFILAVWFTMHYFLAKEFFER